MNKTEEPCLAADRNNIIEECALVVDQCNHEGPYQAIGAARRIRQLKSTSRQAPHSSSEGGR